MPPTLACIARHFSKITGCLLNYPYFKQKYELIAIDLSKQQALDGDPKAIQQINFTGNLNRGEDVNYNTVVNYNTWFTLLNKRKRPF